MILARFVFQGSSFMTSRCCGDFRWKICRPDIYRWTEFEPENLSNLFAWHNRDKDRRGHRVEGQLRRGSRGKRSTGSSTPSWPPSGATRREAWSSPRSSPARPCRRIGQPMLQEEARKVRKVFEQIGRHFGLVGPWQRWQPPPEMKPEHRSSFLKSNK